MAFFDSSLEETDGSFLVRGGAPSMRVSSCVDVRLSTFFCLARKAPPVEGPQRRRAVALLRVSATQAREPVAVLAARAAV